MPVLNWLSLQIAKQVGQIFCWAVVCFGVGVWVYFTLPYEPEPPMLLVAGALLLSAFAILGYLRKGVGGIRGSWTILFGLLLGLGVFGYIMAAVNARAHAAPVLAYHYYGPIYGRVVQIDRSASHALRLTLDRVLLSGFEKAETPRHVRVSLHGPQDWLVPQPGQYVGLTGHLSGPNGPVEPGGFDFQRHAWFLKLGGVGYTRTPVLEMQPPERALPIARLRHVFSQRITGYLPGDIGGFAAAVTTGDRSSFSQEALDALRVSNLAHLLAISGLHMGLLAGFLFAVLRLGLSLWQPVALRLPVKKIAALCALLGASCYLLLSGASIATQRAYIMAAVALLAVSLDRRALTLRAVAIAAWIVLIVRPSSLLSPGFQMSFAATTALVAVFSAIRHLPDIGLKRWQKPVFAVILSSTVAGLATAPFAAAQFNQWAAYGLLANVCAVPVMGVIVVPGAVLAALLAPLGLDWIGLDVMALGLRWILFVAHWVAGLEGARVPVVTPQSVVLPLISLGGVWLVLWQGALRSLGGVAVFCAIAIWSQAERPDVLISADGKLVGVMTKAGRVLSKARGQGFVAQNWLENDGDPVAQDAAAARGEGAQGSVFSVQRGGFDVLHVQGKRGVLAFEGCLPATAHHTFVVSDQNLADVSGCLVFDAQRLKASGAVAIWVKDSSLRVQSVSQHRGQRLWSPNAQKKAPPVPLAIGQ